MKIVTKINGLKFAVVINRHQAVRRYHLITLHENGTTKEVHAPLTPAAFVVKYGFSPTYPHVLEDETTVEQYNYTVENAQQPSPT